ncbi:MAG: DUF1501 domain-containing protein [Gemmataceae bacterium]
MPPTRRQFLAASAAVALPAVAAAKPRAASTASTADSVIFLMLTGGPSQLDTWDPKPDAPSDVRSPFAPIRTRVPGVHVTELFPKMATIADKFALVRGVHHTDAPIHEVGFQWVNTGRLFRDGPEWPTVGCVFSWLKGFRAGDGPYVATLLSSGPIRTGLEVSHGQGCGWLDPTDHRPMTVDVPTFVHGTGMAGGLVGVHRKFGWHSVITINHFSTVFNSPSWDCHAAGGALACDLNDYRDTVAPSFDAAFTQLVTDLEERGLLERTLVVATGEFGRTPKFNCNGGRDHWPGVWTTIFAGGGVKGGRVVGSSDAIGSEPKDRPVHARDIPATIFHALGIEPDATIPVPDGEAVKVYDGRPVAELF